MSGNAGFYSCNKQTSPPDVRFKCKAKFAEKVLVWPPLSSKGVSALHIGKTEGPAINADVYRQKCLPRLLEFIVYKMNIFFGLTLPRLIMQKQQ